MKMIDIKTKIDLIFSFNLKLIICRLWSHDPQRSNSTIDQHLLRDDQHPLVDIPGVQPGLSHYSLAQYPHQHGQRQRLKTDFRKEFLLIIKHSNNAMPIIYQESLNPSISYKASI